MMMVWRVSISCVHLYLQSRIEAAGGYIWWDRVMGELAISRAIGDHGLRPYVIAQPEVRQWLDTRHTGEPDGVDGTLRDQGQHVAGVVSLMLAHSKRLKR